MTIAINRISPAAIDWLTEPAAARLLHIFNHTCNLVDEKRRVISIVPAEVGAGPLSLVLESGQQSFDFRKYFSTESRVEISDGILQIEELSFLWSHAELWPPQPDWQAVRREPNRLRQALPELTSMIEMLAPPGGLAPLLNKTANAPGVNFSDEWVEAAREPAARLIQGLNQGNLEASIAGAEKLAGLGGGLTPSGDDFIIGAIHAAWATLEINWTQQAASALAGAAGPSTNPLSSAWLDRAALGEATEDWHILLAAILQDDTQTFQRITRKLLQIGHTSGADALSGFVALLRETTSAG